MATPFERLNGMQGNRPQENSAPDQDNMAVAQDPRNAVSSQPQYQQYIGDSARVPMGIPGFDRLIEGGFKRGSLNIIAGETGSGKTVFASSFIVNGARFFNEVGIYLSFDEEEKTLLDNLKRFKWNNSELIAGKMVHFVNYSPSQLQQMINEGGGLLDNLMTSTKAKRLVLDPITSFLLMSSEDINRREQMASLIKLLLRWDVTTLLVDQSPPISVNSKQDNRILNYQCDSIVQLHYLLDMLGKERRRFLEVYKMRGTNHVTKAVPFIINSNGINILG